MPQAIHRRTMPVLFLILVVTLAACDPQTPTTLPPDTTTPTTPSTDDRVAVIGEPVTMSALPGWSEDKLDEFWPALINNCRVMPKKQEEWGGICQQAKAINQPDDATVRQFITTHFEAAPLFDKNNQRKGLLTGYYEPLLRGSRTPDETYRFPLYASPKDMLKLDIAGLYTSLEDRRVRGRLTENNRVVPYYSRAEIDGPDKPLAGQEILWVDDRDDAFFLHIQGSGRVKLKDGKIVSVGYANQNGHPFVAIGKLLRERGELAREGITLFTIKQWLKDNPSKAQDLLNENPSYIFFTLREEPETGPRGSLNVPLTSMRSIAIDRRAIPLGSLVWVDTSYPDIWKSKLQRLMIAQDTGGAIKGQLRGDFFFGHGEQAEKWAGGMKRPVQFYLLRPKTGQTQ